jgi:hypothetical protein
VPRWPGAGYGVADRAYDSDPLVAALAVRSSQAGRPPRRNRHPSAQRPARERLVSRLKQVRRRATRY